MLELLSRRADLDTTADFQRPQLLAHLLAGFLEAFRLRSHLRMQAGIEFGLLLQLLLQRADLVLQKLAFLVRPQRS